MLCQFTFQNFKSYKNETTLDYQAAVLPEFKNTLITETSAPDLLPVNVVYGPNGGGKSNLLQALACVISTVVKPRKSSSGKPLLPIYPDHSQAGRNIAAH